LVQTPTNNKANFGWLIGLKLVIKYACEIGYIVEPKSKGLRIPQQLQISSYHLIL